MVGVFWLNLMKPEYFHSEGINSIQIVCLKPLGSLLKILRSCCMTYWKNTDALNLAAVVLSVARKNVLSVSLSSAKLTVGRSTRNYSTQMLVF